MNYQQKRSRQNNVLILFAFGMIGIFSTNRLYSEVQIKEGKLFLNETGTHYIKLSFTSQIWFRYGKLNPGSLQFGNSITSSTDIGIRRYRVQLFGQLTDRIFIYSQFGENNFNSISERKFGFFVHDVVGEYQLTVKKFPISIGAGLTGWGGPSRFSSPAVGTFLGVDAPLYQQSTNDVTDQFLRKLGVYVKGKLGRIDYRFCMAKPMAIQRSSFASNEITHNASFSNRPTKMQWNGYVYYGFFDAESNLTPYMTGTYLGKKKVLNLGFGFSYQPKAMWMLGDQVGDTLYHSMMLLAADIYADLPLGKKGISFSAYGDYTYSDFGKGYLRNLAVMNPANGVSAGGDINGSGNGFPDYGTGHTLYVQAGLKLPDHLIGKATLLPYAACQTSWYNRLATPMIFTDAGCSILLDNHKSKLTLAYQNRPLYKSDGSNDGRRGAFITQYQVYF